MNASVSFYSHLFYIRHQSSIFKDWTSFSFSANFGIILIVVIVEWSLENEIITYLASLSVFIAIPIYDQRWGGAGAVFSIFVTQSSDKKVDNDEYEWRGYGLRRNRILSVRTLFFF